MNMKDSSLAPGAQWAVEWQDFIGAIPGTALEQAGMTTTRHDSSTITLRELTGTSLLRVHSLLPFLQLKNAMAGCEVALPGEVNQSLGEDPAVLCLAPGEWLLFSEFLDIERLLVQLQPAIDPRHTATLDLSAASTIFRLDGSGAPWLLNKLGGLDFQLGITAGAHCARTRLQHAAVTIHYHAPGGHAGDAVFDLIFDRSLASYLWQLLIASIPHAEQLNQHYGIRK